MPIEGIEDLKKQYYDIINQVALTPEDERQDQQEKWQKSLTNLENEAKSAEIETEGFVFNVEEVGKSEKSYLDKVSNFYKNIREGAENIENIDNLDIPDANKKEIKAQGFVLAFDAMKENADNKDKFLQCYNNVQKMSEGVDSLQVQESNLKKELGNARGILDAFAPQYTQNKNADNIGNIFTQVANDYIKQEQVLEKQKKEKDQPERKGEKMVITPEQVKEQIARNILEVAGVSDGQISAIMNDPDSRKSIMKRAGQALEKMGIKDDDITQNPDKAFEKIDDQTLQGVIRNQAKELTAQIGRVNSYSIDNQDMRGNENLHKKYAAKANKMKSAVFDKNALKALKYEKSKDERSKKKGFLYNLYRKPMQLINKLRPTKDKPLLSPWQKIFAGVIALAVLAPPFGMIAAAFMLASAFKDTKAFKWLDEKIFGKPKKRFNHEKCNAITKEGLFKGIQKTQEQEKVQEKEKTQEKNQELQKSEKKGKGVEEQVVKVSKGGTKEQVRDQKSDMFSLNTTDPKVRSNQADINVKQPVEIEMTDMSEKARLARETKKAVDKIIQKNIEERKMAKKEGRKSSSLDDTDLMSAKMKIENERKISGSKVKSR